MLECFPSVSRRGADLKILCSIPLAEYFPFLEVSRSRFSEPAQLWVAPVIDESAKKSGVGQPIPPLLSEIQVATTNAGARTARRLDPRLFGALKEDALRRALF